MHVQLTKKDRKQIAGMLNKGWESARVLRRALILRELGQGQRSGQVACDVGVASKTVRSVARRYEEEGLESALYEKPRPGQRRVLDAGQSQRIIALVCGPPPEGREKNGSSGRTRILTPTTTKELNRARSAIIVLASV
jgi:transposase